MTTNTQEFLNEIEDKAYAAFLKRYLICETTRFADQGHSLAYQVTERFWRKIKRYPNQACGRIGNFFKKSPQDTYFWFPRESLVESSVLKNIYSDSQFLTRKKAALYLGMTDHQFFEARSNYEGKTGRKLKYVVNQRGNIRYTKELLLEWKEAHYEHFAAYYNKRAEGCNNQFGYMIRSIEINEQEDALKEAA